LSLGHYIYLLRCKNNSLYCGYTTDLPKRMHSHLFSKTGAKYTKVFRPLAIACAFSIKADLSFTLKMEYAIKQLSKEKKRSACQWGRFNGYYTKRANAIGMGCFSNA
jgi:putative endonuclease